MACWTCLFGILERPNVQVIHIYWQVRHLQPCNWIWNIMTIHYYISLIYTIIIHDTAQIHETPGMDSPRMCWHNPHIVWQSTYCVMHWWYITLDSDKPGPNKGLPHHIGPHFYFFSCHRQGPRYINPVLIVKSALDFNVYILRVV